MTDEKQENLISRPPIVVVLGHVDSGKTSILDAIRKTHIAEKESGGITQHVGAYEVDYQNKKITFIDTPGHEAFSAMRSRGAKVADIAILVIDACAGVQPQTKEAISHIKKAGIQMIVAINKIDAAGANPEKAKRELAQNEVLTESMGGKIPSIEISAKTGKKLSELLEMILLLAEMEEFKADRNQPGEGVVIEAYLNGKRGPTATLLLRNGRLEPGQIIGTRSASGKIKILENFQGKPLQTALPSMPVIVLGLEKTPRVGEKFKIFSDIESAQKYIEKKERKEKGGDISLIESKGKILNLILKTDVIGSLEPLEQMMKTLPVEKITLRILKSEAGEINENDVRLAQSAKAKIFGFRTKPNPIALKLAEQQNVRIITFDIIYELIQAARQMMERSAEPELTRVDLGKIKVLLVFWAEKNRQIVGGKVIAGEVKKGFSIEVWRNEELKGKGRIISLQKQKKDIDQAAKGEEIGMLYEGNVKIEEKDILAVFREEKKKKYEPGFARK